MLRPCRAVACNFGPRDVASVTALTAAGKELLWNAGQARASERVTHELPEVEDALDQWQTATVRA